MPLQNQDKPHLQPFHHLMTILFSGNDPIDVIDMNICYESLVVSYSTGCFFLGSLKFCSQLFFSNTLIYI